MATKVGSGSSTVGEFSLQNYDAIGFDMDHTLCRYHLASFFEMEYQALADYMVEEREYDPKLRRPLAEDVDFLHKGLVFDIEAGNFLKLSADGVILRASHGTRLMSQHQVADTYGSLHSNGLLREFVTDLIESTEGPLHRQFRPFKDYFDLPAALMCARVVDLLDEENGGQPLEEYWFWKEVLLGLVEMFKRDNIRSNTGGYYPKIRSSPESYLIPCSDNVKSWLKNLHKRQVTFMVSGSDPEYVDQIATFSLGHNWRDYFDFIVCASKKPGFFTAQRPFHKLSPNSVSTPDEAIDLDDTLSSKTIYLQGNWTQLKSSIGEYCDVDHPRCIYFGDHLIQDVLAADRSRLESVAIVEEMSAEGMILQPTDAMAPHPAEAHLNSKMWGSFFYDFHPSSSGGVVFNSPAERMNTVWSSLIRKHARLSIPDVETLAAFPVDHRFVTSSRSTSNPRFLGFLPGLPSSLT